MGLLASSRGLIGVALGHIEVDLADICLSDFSVKNTPAASPSSLGKLGGHLCPIP
jgi:hypothetical protein